jgi:hypothetical protein
MDKYDGRLTSSVDGVACGKGSPAFGNWDEFLEESEMVVHLNL